MILHTAINNEDAEILNGFCETEHISISALLNALVSDFLDCTDKTHINNVVNRAKNIKPGRPKQYY